MIQESLARLPTDAKLIPPQPLGLDVQAHLGRQLRAVFDDLARQPVPDKFAALLEELEHKSPKAGAEASASGPEPAARAAKAGDA